MKDFHLRGLEIALLLQNHKKVKVVNHPGLYPQEFSSSQIWGYASLFSFELDTDKFDQIPIFKQR